jgi:hypothetical protein
MNIPTAKEWVETKMNVISVKDATEQLRIFTKMHVDEALNTALKRTTAGYDSGGPDWSFSREEVITEAYPIERIK